jgi:hypothetical protein
MCASHCKPLLHMGGIAWIICDLASTAHRVSAACNAVSCCWLNGCCGGMVIWPALLLLPLLLA